MEDIAAAAPTPSSGPLAIADLRALLARSSWPPETHAAVERISLCEAGLDTDGDLVKDAVDPLAAGDGGRAMGVLQLRRDVHRDLAASYDLLDAAQNLEAGYVVYQRAGRALWPWSCA
jgi:hypothetical protein